jgi:prevent-host-death family protein
MPLTASDIIPLTQARANLSELADEVKAGAEKIITKNGESYVALIDADRLDYYHRLERERVHLLLIDEVEKGLADVRAGRTRDAREVLAGLKSARSGAAAVRTAKRRR